MGFLNSKNLSAVFGPRLLVAIILAISVAATPAQESLRKVVYGGASNSGHKKDPPRKKADPPKKVSTRSVAVKKPAATTTSKKVKTATSRRPPTRPGWINVTFESKEPNTQIFLNGNRIGITDDTRTFQWNMTPGLYRISGVIGTSIVFPDVLVQLRSDKMTVPLYQTIAEKEPEKKEEVPLVPQKTQAEIEMEIAREMSAKVIRIFDDYLDAHKSSTITNDDWQFVASAAVLGEFQNLSRQQIEAQRKFAAGQVALAAGDVQKAFAEFRLGTQGFPSSPILHIGVGDAYVASAQWQDARKSYEQARSVGPNVWMAHRRLGDIYRILGEKRKAVLAYADAVKFGDDRYETRVLRAQAMVDAENYAAAIPALEELLKEKPSSEAYVALGEAFEMQKRDVAALDNYRKAVEIDPNSPIAQYRLARVYFEQREFQKAVDGFDAAIKLDGEKNSFPHDDAKEKRSTAQSRMRPATR